MIFRPTKVAGAFLIDVERRRDRRGHFARTYSADAFRAAGIDLPVRECSVAFNRSAGTLRGLHYQAAPHAESKLVRCTRGAIYDVAVDLRRRSPTYLAWAGARLSEENARMLFVPKGCAHGYVTLAPGTEVFYQISTRHHPASSRGVRWNDPAFGIRWPRRPHLIHARDATYPDYAP